MSCRPNNCEQRSIACFVHAMQPEKPCTTNAGLFFLGVIESHHDFAFNLDRSSYSLHALGHEF